MASFTERARSISTGKEILRRSAGADDLPEAGLHELADELFRSYDAEEAARAEG